MGFSRHLVASVLAVALAIIVLPGLTHAGSTPFASFFGGSSGSGGGGCTPTALALALEVVPGYKPPSITPNFAAFGIPDTSGGRPRGLPAEAKSPWYKNMPSPGIGCDNTTLCLDHTFAGLANIRVAAIVATPKLTLLGAMQIPRMGLDLISQDKSNGCSTITHWTYATAPINNANPSIAFKIPKNTQVDLSYSCQPNNDDVWKTDTTCVLWMGSCNVADHNAIFRLANKAVINGVSGSTLHSSETRTVAGEGGQTFTLSCGGYKPEDGTKANDGIPSQYDSTNVSRGNDWWDDHPDTYTYFNIPDASFFTPTISLNVEECANDDEVVVDNVCTPCGEIMPGSWRIDNICVTFVPVLTIDVLVNGASVSTVAPGTKVTIQATYLATTSDPITATVINGGTNGKDAAVCTTKNCIKTTYNSKKTFATSTYTFTPTATGTYTYYPSVQTKVLTMWKNYGDVSKTLTVGKLCPDNATQTGTTCKCNDQYANYIGGACVLLCPATKHANQAGSTCISNLPTAASIEFSATRVRSGNPSTLSWTIPGMASDIACAIAPVSGLQGAMPAWAGGSPWTGSVQTVPITQATRYVLSCSNGEETVSKEVISQLIPAFQEI